MARRFRREIFPVVLMSHSFVRGELKAGRKRRPTQAISRPFVAAAVQPGPLSGIGPETPNERYEYLVALDLDREESQAGTLAKERLTSPDLELPTMPWAS